MRLSGEVSKVLMELSDSIHRRRHCSPELLSNHLHQALHDLNTAIKSQPRLFLGSEPPSSRRSPSPSMLAHALAHAHAPSTRPTPPDTPPSAATPATYAHAASLVAPDTPALPATPTRHAHAARPDKPTFPATHAHATRPAPPDTPASPATHAHAARPARPDTPASPATPRLQKPAHTHRNCALSSMKTDSSALMEWKQSSNNSNKMLRPQLSRIAIMSLEFSEALPLAAFASLLVETVAKLDHVIEEVEELGRMARFKEFDDNSVCVDVKSSSTPKKVNVVVQSQLPSHGTD